MKLTRMLPPLARVAALAIAALGGVPVRAADSTQGLAASLAPSQFPWDAPALRLTNEGGRRATTPNAKMVGYNLRTAAWSDSKPNSKTSMQDGSIFDFPIEFGARKPGEIGLSVERRAGWSPRVASGSGARLLNLHRELFNISQNGLVTVVDRRLVHSRVALGRHRIVIQLTTGF